MILVAAPRWGDSFCRPPFFSCVITQTLTSCPQERHVVDRISCKTLGPQASSLGAMAGIIGSRFSWRVLVEFGGPQHVLPAQESHQLSANEEVDLPRLLEPASDHLTL
jgi:hypothetical protein